MRNYLRALSFLTIIPLPHVQFGPGGRELSDSASCFPLAGATLGLLLAGAALLFSFLFPPGPVVVMVLVFSFFLTRGLHFDGLADTADGLIGTTDREKAFKAMDDSAIGVMGAASILFLYLLKYALLVSFEGIVLLSAALLFMPLAGRWAIVYAGSWFAPARSRGLGDLFLRELRWPILLKASAGAFVIIGFLAWWQPQLAVSVLVGCVLALIGAQTLAFYANFRLGGLNGDILGAASELGELLFLAGFFIAQEVVVAVNLTAKAVIDFAQAL